MQILPQNVIPGDDTISLVISEKIPEETRHALFDWDADPFRSKIWGLSWRQKEHHVTLYKDGVPASHVGMLRETVKAGNQSVEVGGLGDVITVPAFQGQGFAQRTIQEAVSFLNSEWRLRYGLLFCFPELVAFYERLGWSRRKQPVWISQPAGRIQMPALCMSRAWSRVDFPDGEIEVGGLPW